MDVRTLKNQIDDWVKKQLSYVDKSALIARKKPKIIHDSVHGTHLFWPWEMAVIDTPIIQRLRFISQVDLLSLVFPSANHTRFDHTIGVTAMAERVGRSLMGRKEYKRILNEQHIRELRMAAILHDCGHGFMSHLSEHIYKPLMKEVLEKEPFVDKRPHEVLSFLIVTSPAFKKFFNEVVEKGFETTYELNRVARMIIGKTQPKEAFLGQIINGPFDCDKLDYLVRDAKFTGLRIGVDLDRILHTMHLRIEAGRTELVIDISGAPSLEQLYFGKMMLNSVVYHHHKLRAVERMFESIIRLIQDDEKIDLDGIKFKTPVDFLRFMDHDVLARVPCRSDLIKDKITQLINRRLYKRALVICTNSVTPETRWYLQDLRTAVDYEDRKEDLQNLIYEKARARGVTCPKTDIWLDILPAPSFRDASWAYIREPSPDPPKKYNYTPLREFFPFDKWVSAFNEHKWRGYVFCPPDEHIRKKIHEAAKEALGIRPGLKFNDQSFIMCKFSET